MALTVEERIKEAMHRRRESLNFERANESDGAILAEKIMRGRFLVGDVPDEPEQLKEFCKQLNLIGKDWVILEKQGIEYKDMIGRAEEQNAQLHDKLETLQAQVSELRAETEVHQTTEAPRTRTRFTDESHEPYEPQTNRGAPYKSTKIPDPPAFTDGKELTFDAWKRGIRNKLRANEDHYPSEFAKLTYALSESKERPQSSSSRMSMTIRKNPSHKLVRCSLCWNKSTGSQTRSTRTSSSLTSSNSTARSLARLWRRSIATPHL